MPRTIFYLFVYLLVLLSLHGCSPVRTHYDFDPTVNFSVVRTYAWGDVNVPEDALAANPLLKKRIMAAVDRHLYQMGYRSADPAVADIYVAIHAGMKEKMQIVNWDGPQGYFYDPWYHPWWDRGYYGNRIDVNYYTEGTLVIDIVDRIRKELIWRGLGTRVINIYSDIDEMEKTIDQYVRNILYHFPPR